MPFTNVLPSFRRPFCCCVLTTSYRVQRSRWRADRACPPLARECLKCNQITTDYNVICNASKPARPIGGATRRRRRPITARCVQAPLGGSTGLKGSIACSPSRVRPISYVNDVRVCLVWTNLKMGLSKEKSFE